MFSNHFMDVSLSSGQGSLAYFSREPQEKAIVFVHGFTGHAVNTWGRIHELLVCEDAAAGVDLVFYGYESTRARAHLSAGMLRQFLEDMNNPKGSFHSKMPPERRSSKGVHKYGEIVIVAHSLGGAIARRAMLDSLSSSWAKKVKLVLFAPAHQGASLAALALEFAGAVKLLAAFAAIAQFGVPSLIDLKPDSKFLKLLTKETSDALKKRSNDSLKAAQVIFGLGDRVVNPGNFCGDPNFDVWENHGHMSVCKASNAFRAPLVEILKHL
jgi:alpha-beta hydrolase superfamily lysophospholipase